MPTLRRLLRSERSLSVVLIILVALMTHAPLIPELGYYRDDWYLIWTGHTQGFEKIPNLFLLDRPFMGLVYSLDYLILGDNPLNWHLYAFFLQVLGSLAFFWILRMLYPRHRLATTAAALLFVVYPGFLQQPNANTFQNHLFGYAVALISIALTIRAVKTDRRQTAVILSVLSIILALIYFLIYEYMIGLEGFRVLLLWIALRQKETQSFGENLKRLLKRGWIYIPGMVAFLFWRFFIFEGGRRATDADAIIRGYTDAPIRGFARLMIETSKDIIETALFAWAIPFYEFVNSATYSALIPSTLLALVAIGLFTIYYFWLKRNDFLQEEDKQINHWSLPLFWIGGLTIVSTLLPVVAAGRDVFFDNQFDRYTLQASAGVSLFLIGLLFYGVRDTPRFFILITLIGIGVVTHFHSANYYREFWDLQREVWWQLSWRAPALEEGTVLVTVLPSGFRHAEAYESWGPANLIYYPDADELKILAEVLNESTSSTIIRGASDSRRTRGFIDINRDYDKTLIASMPNSHSCLHVIDGRQVELAKEEDPLVEQVAPHSMINQIRTDNPNQTPPPIIFGAEPEHKWCFYYQKMSLARQKGDWELVVNLGSEALEQDYKPLDRSEWMPLLEGYANTGNDKEAKQLATIIKDDKDLGSALCKQLENPVPYPGTYNRDFIVEILCSP